MHRCLHRVASAVARWRAGFGRGDRPGSNAKWMRGAQALYFLTAPNVFSGLKYTIPASCGKARRCLLRRAA